MTRVLIYLFPAAIDFAMASAAFVGSVRGADAGWEPSKIASLFAVWAVTYMIVCQVVARIVTPQNATRLLIGSCILLAATSAAFIIFPDPKTMHYLMVPIAVGTGFFFAPFQVFMKAFNQARHRSVAYSAGLFLFAWSAGFAIGPFVAGFLWKLVNWEACHALNIVVEVGTAAGVYFFEHRVHARPAPQSPQPAAAPARLHCARGSNEQPDDFQHIVEDLGTIRSDLRTVRLDAGSAGRSSIAKSVPYVIRSGPTASSRSLSCSSFPRMISTEIFESRRTVSMPRRHERPPAE